MRNVLILALIVALLSSPCLAQAVDVKAGFVASEEGTFIPKADMDKLLADIEATEKERDQAVEDAKHAANKEAICEKEKTTSAASFIEEIGKRNVAIQERDGEIKLWGERLKDCRKEVRGGAIFEFSKVQFFVDFGMFLGLAWAANEIGEK